MCEIFGIERSSVNRLFDAMFPDPPRFRTNVLLADEIMTKDIQTISIPHGWCAPEVMITGSAAEYSIDIALTDIGDIDSMTWDNKTFACFDGKDPTISAHETLESGLIRDHYFFNSLSETDKMFALLYIVDEYTLASCVINDIGTKERVMFTENLMYKLKLDRRYPGYVNMEEHGIFRFTKASNVASDWAYEPYPHMTPIKMSTYKARYRCSSIPNIKSEYRGPSLKTYKTSKTGFWFDYFDRDNLWCTRCPFWPPNAKCFGVGHSSA